MSRGRTYARPPSAVRPAKNVGSRPSDAYITFEKIMRALLLIACAIGGARAPATPRPTPRPNLREDDAVKGNHGLRNGPARTKQPALVSTAEGVLPLLYDAFAYHPSFRNHHA